MNGASKTDGTEMDVLLLAGAAFAVAAIIFYLFRIQILTFLLWIKYYELSAISFFLPNRVYLGLENWVKMTPVQRVSYDQLMLLSSEIGNTLKYPCMGITLFLAAILAWLHPGNSFNEVESMVSLKEKLRKDFPSVQVVMGWDLAKEDIDNGPWAMAQTPIEFGKKHHLLYRNPDNNMVMVDKIRAKVLFCQQLGPLWPGVEQLPPYQKALFAAFCAFINYNRDEAENFLANIERSVTRAKLNKKELDFSGTAALIKKYGNSPDVQRILKDHAYFHTVFIEMLATARRSGIVANSSYLWLKPIDRPLWYALNNLGRKAVFVEMASAHAHWLAEKKLGFALTEPMVEEAIYGLEEAVKIRVVRDI